MQSKIHEVIKVWCTKCHKTTQCFIFDEEHNFENPDCDKCKRQCPPCAATIKVICPACTRKILRETGLEPTGGTQAGNCRWWTMECRACSKIVTEPCEVLKKHTKLE